MKSLIVRAVTVAVAVSALLALPAAAETNRARSAVPATAMAETSPVRSAVPFRLTVPGATADGTYQLAAGNKPGRLDITLKVSARTTCGVLQMTTNGPADGIEWFTFGSLCKPGTATFRTEATRLPWSTGTLPSIRVCNGLSTALAEGDECDDFDPPRRS